MEFSQCSELHCGIKHEIFNGSRKVEILDVYRRLQNGHDIVVENGTVHNWYFVGVRIRELDPIYVRHE